MLREPGACGIDIAPYLLHERLEGLEATLVLATPCTGSRSSPNTSTAKTPCTGVRWRCRKMFAVGKPMVRPRLSPCATRPIIR